MKLDALENKFAYLSAIPLVAGATQAVLDFSKINVGSWTLENSLGVVVTGSALVGIVKGVDDGSKLNHKKQGVAGFYVAGFAATSAVLYGVGYFTTKYFLDACLN